MGPALDCLPGEGSDSPELSVVSCEALASHLSPGISSIPVVKSSVLRGLQEGKPLVLPVSLLGLQQYASWALTPPSNCFSALSEGLQDARVGFLAAEAMLRHCLLSPHVQQQAVLALGQNYVVAEPVQVAHFLNDADTLRSIVNQLADLLNLVTDWSTSIGTQLAAALRSMPVDLCNLILESSRMDLSYVLANLPAEFHTISLHPFITPASSGQLYNLANRLPRSSVRPLSALTLQHCVHLDLASASVGGAHPPPERMSLPSLTSLSLSRARFTTSGALPFLSSLLCPTLKTLDLSFLHLRPQMYAALATSVATLTELTHIDLSHRLGAVQGTLYSRLLCPLFSAASQLPVLCSLVGASVAALGCVPSTLATLSKLPTLSMDVSECSTALAEKLSAASVPLHTLKVTMPPFLLGSDTAQEPNGEVDTSHLIQVLTAVSPSLLSLRMSSIRTNTDIWVVPVDTVAAMTSLTYLSITYTPLETLHFLDSLIHLQELHLVGTVPTTADPAEFSTHLHALTALTLFNFDAGQEFDRTHVDPSVWSLGVDAGMLRGQLAASLPKMPNLAHLAFLTRDVEIEGDLDVEFVAALGSLAGCLTTLRLDSSFSVATPGFAEWLQTCTALQCLELMDVQTQSPDECVHVHAALGSLTQLTRLDLSWFGCPGAMERTVAAFTDAVVQLTALKIIELYGSVHDVQTDERKAAAMDTMLTRALPALPQLEEISLQALQLASAEGAAVIASCRGLTALSLCDLVFKDATAARRFGAAISGLSTLRRLRTDWVELIEQPSVAHSRDGGDYSAMGSRSRLLSITGWLLTGEFMWGPGAGIYRTLRVLEVEDYHGLDWGVLGARVSCLSQLQALEIDGMTFERKPTHAEALLRQLLSLGNLEEVRLMTNFEAVASGFDDKDQQRLKKLLPTASVSFVGHRMCGPNCLPLC